MLSSCMRVMGQRFSSKHPDMAEMAANAEKTAGENTAGEEKTFMCAVSTGS